MKQFERIIFNINKCRRQFKDLQSLLRQHGELAERKDVLSFFRMRPHLSLYLANYNRKIVDYDRIAWEFDLFGDFACDLVVGDSITKNFLFIEFEGAGPKSIFEKKARKATREWSRHFEHGYSQIIDWIYKLSDREKSNDYDDRFGTRTIGYEALLVIGRDAVSLHTAEEQRRLEWRTEHVIVHSKKIHCVTFDQLVRHLEAHLHLLSKLNPTSAAETRP